MQNARMQLCRHSTSLRATCDAYLCCVAQKNVFGVATLKFQFVSHAKKDGYMASTKAIYPALSASSISYIFPSSKEEMI